MGAARLRLASFALCYAVSNCGNMTRWGSERSERERSRVNCFGLLQMIRIKAKRSVAPLNASKQTVYYMLTTARSCAILRM